MPSAKHDFQLLRILKVAGLDFVYNVDFLHPGERAQNPEMFVDHLALPVPLSEYRDDSFIMKSIVMPEAAFLFDGHSTPFSLEAITPHGRHVTVNIPLMDEVGLIVTKSESVGVTKRRRDPLDIYLAISQVKNYSELVSKFRRLRSKNEAVYNTLYGVWEAVEKHDFSGRVEMLITELQLTLEPSSATRECIESQMKRFFTDVGLDPRAHNPDRHSRSGAG